MKKIYSIIYISIICSTVLSGQIPMKKGKVHELVGFVMVSGGIAMPTQHFASAYGDYIFHNASGFALTGYSTSLEAGLMFPTENCQISIKTSFGSNQFDMDRYLQFLREPPSQVYLSPGGPAVNYSAISSGFYKYISSVLKVESEIPVKKFSVGFYCAIGSTKFLSFPDVKVAMDSSSNHIVTGFSAVQKDSLGYSTYSQFGVALNYGLTATYHFNSHLFLKLDVNYYYSRYIFNLNYITARETGNVWSTKTEVVRYAIPLTTMNFHLGIGYRF